MIEAGTTSDVATPELMGVRALNVFGKPNIKPGFGFPLCRFFTRWSFTIKPDKGWTDIRGRLFASGPTFEVPNHDLSAKPTSFSYMLTDAYRFDEPDESTQRPPGADPGANPHFVTLTPEIVLHIAAKSN